LIQLTLLSINRIPEKLRMPEVWVRKQFCESPRSLIGF
jgi:hypothetical protein